MRLLRPGRHGVFGPATRVIRLLPGAHAVGGHAAGVFAAARNARWSVREIVNVTSGEPAALSQPAFTERTAAILRRVRGTRQLCAATR